MASPIHRAWSFLRSTPMIWRKDTPLLPPEEGGRGVSLQQKEVMACIAMKMSTMTTDHTVYVRTTLPAENSEKMPLVRMAPTAAKATVSMESWSRSDLTEVSEGNMDQ